ncbi:MAG: ABC transporter substrate-binding protein [Dehalococcoidia bacterium]
MNSNYWGRWHDRQLGRRRFIATGAAGALGVVALASGCGDDDDSSSDGTASASPGQTSTQEPKKGGTYKIVDLSVGAADPAKFQTEPLFYTVYEPLGLWKQTEAEPVLASKWEQPDPSTIIFHMDPAARWQNKAPLNGRPLTSQDVKYSVEYFTSPQPGFIRRSHFAAVDVPRTETPNDATVKLNLSTPSVAQLTNLVSLPVFFILPREIIERDGDMTKDPIGSGPFTVKSYTPQGPTEMVRNESYWKSGVPYVDSLQTLYITDNVATKSAFSTGNLDQMINVTPQDLSELPQSTQALKSSQWWFIGTIFNQNRKPFDDPRVRRALHLAIDRAALNEIVYSGEASPVSAVVPAYGKYSIPESTLMSQPGYRQQKDEDLSEAKKLLDAAGANDLSFPLVTYGALQQWVTAATVLAAQWDKIGVKCTPTPQPGADYGKTASSGDFTAYFAFGGGTGDPDSVVRSFFHSSGSQNWTKYNNPELDAMLAKELAEPDESERIQIFQDIQNLLLREVPTATIVDIPWIGAAQPYVKGLADWWGPNFASWSHAVGHATWLDR